MRNFLLSVRQIFQFQFWPHRRYCHVILGQLLQIYDVISIFQDNGRSRSILLPVSYLLMSLPSGFRRSKAINKPIFVYINGRHLWLRYNDFWFEKNKRPPYWNSTSSSDLDHFLVICISFCISLFNFRGVFRGEPKRRPPPKLSKH